MRPGAIATLAVPLCLTGGTLAVRLRPAAWPGDPAAGYEGTSRHAPVLRPVTLGFDFEPEAELTPDSSPTRTATGWRWGFQARAWDDSPQRTVRLDLGDGTIVDAPSDYVEHEYRAPGSYVATLVVTDPGGRIARSSATVTVPPDPPPEPEPPPDQPSS